MFKFGEFTFHPEQQSLFRAEELVVLKRNQSVLLDFFLRSPEAIHSKEEILDTVWKDQIVSEQVVFQTISQLRAILGNDAIKTYSKRGYKWQIPLTHSKDKNQNDITTAKASHKNSKHKIILLVSLILILASVVLIVKQEHSNQIQLNIISSHNLTTPSLEVKLQQTLNSKLFASQLFKSKLTTEQAMVMPNEAIKQLSLAPDNWVLWHQIYTTKQGYIAKYLVSNGERNWHGFIEATELDELSNRLNSKLEQIALYGFFNKSIDFSSADRIKTLLTTNPNDIDLVLRLASYYSKIQHYDVAHSYLDRVIKLDKSNVSKAYSAIAHWQIGKLYKIRGLNLQSEYSLKAMEEVLDKSALWPLHFQLIKTKAWLHYAETNYLKMYETLENGITKFSQLKKTTDKTGAITEFPYTLFKLHVLYSILALKVDDKENMFSHLHRAQALLMEHQLDSSHMAIVYYHLALFSKHIENSNTQTYTTYLKKSLELSRTAENFWVLDSAFELLIKNLLNEQAYQQALDQLSRKPDSPKWMLLKAEVLLLQGKTQQALVMLEQTFEQARIDYDIRSGIESALKLYQLNDSKPNIQAHYLAYLQSNTTPEWLNRQLLVHNKVN